MAKEFMISGSGETIIKADKRLLKNKKGLTNKLSKANVSTELNLSKSHYQGTYTLKVKCESPACETHFKIESTESWNAIQEKASKHEGCNIHYDTNFSVEQYIQLTTEQQEALEPGPVAGREKTTYNPLERLQL